MVCMLGRCQRIVAVLRKLFQSAQILFTFAVALEFQEISLVKRKQGKAKNG